MGTTFVSCGDDFLSCCNNLLTCGNNLVSCGNDLLSCGNDLVSCGNKFLSCGNDLLTCGNEMLYCGNEIKNDMKTVLSPFLGSIEKRQCFTLLLEHCYMNDPKSCMYISNSSFLVMNIDISFIIWSFQLSIFVLVHLQD